jgi:hypothetical protein
LLEPTENEPVWPWNEVGVPLPLLLATDTLDPVTKLAAKVHTPISSGLKWHSHLLPDVALVSAALPSAAKYPGTVYCLPDGEWTKVTSRR